MLIFPVQCSCSRSRVYTTSVTYSRRTKEPMHCTARLWTSYTDTEKVGLFYFLTFWFLVHMSS